MMKKPKIIITDNREVWRVKKCWEAEIYYPHILNTPAMIKENICRGFANMAKAARDAGIAINKLGEVLNEQE